MKRLDPHHCQHCPRPLLSPRDRKEGLCDVCQGAVKFRPEHVGKGEKKLRHRFLEEMDGDWS